jgi:hypothetical protein
LPLFTLSTGAILHTYTGIAVTFTNRRDNGYQKTVKIYSKSQKIMKYRHPMPVLGAILHIFAASLYAVSLHIGLPLITKPPNQYMKKTGMTDSDAPLSCR